MATGQQVVQVPAHIAARIAARQGARSALLDAVTSGQSYPKISIRASRYRLIDEGVETVVGTEMDVVFIAINPHVSKIFYDKEYTGDSDDKTPPACFSNDGKTPDSSVVTPVSPSCSKCPNNVLGSRITKAGAQSKICGDIRHVAVVTAADPTKAYGLTIPVSAMKALRLYFKHLSQYGLIPEEVITTLGFDDDASFPKITFTHKGYVPEKHLATMAELGAAADTKQIIRVTSAPALPAPASTEAAPAVAVIAAPVMVKEPEPEVVAPKKTKATPVVTEKVISPAPATVGAKAPSDDPVAAGDDPKAALEKQLDDLFA